MITKMHFKYVGSDGLWRSGCSFTGHWLPFSGDHHSAGLIRHRHMLAAEQDITCKVCLKNPRLQKLLEELSPWPDPSLQDERHAAYSRYCKEHPEGTPWQAAFHAARKQGRYIDNGWDVEQPAL